MIWAKILSGALRLANLIAGWMRDRELVQQGKTEQQRDDLLADKARRERADAARADVELLDPQTRFRD